MSSVASAKTPPNGGRMKRKADDQPDAQTKKKRYVTRCDPMVLNGQLTHVQDFHCAEAERL